MKVLSLIRPQLASVCDGNLTRKSISDTSFLSRRVYFSFSPRILKNQRTGPNSACAPQPGGDCAFLLYSHTLYHSYISVFAVHTTVVNIKLIPEPSCIFYELSVFYRPVRSQLLNFILWCPRPDSNRHAFRHLILSQTSLPFHHSGIYAVFKPVPQTR